MENSDEEFGIRYDPIVLLLIVKEMFWMISNCEQATTQFYLQDY